MKKETKRLLVRGTFFLLYLVMGMVVFRLLESHNEQAGMLKAKQAVDHMLIKHNISHEEMKEFVAIITEAESWGYTSGWLEKWSFTGSLFFSGTVITTIGKSFFMLWWIFCFVLILSYFPNFTEELQSKFLLEHRINKILSYFMVWSQKIYWCCRNKINWTIFD